MKANNRLSRPVSRPAAKMRAVAQRAFLGLLSTAALAGASSINSDISMTIDGGACAGFELDGLPQKFGYTLEVGIE